MTDRGDADCRNKDMNTPIVSGVNTAQVLEFDEHVRDVMALTIQRLVVGDILLAASGRWDASFDLAFGQHGSEPA